MTHMRARVSAAALAVLTAAFLVVPITGAEASIASCRSNQYQNSSGNCVNRPSSPPSGASAKCRDGSYSYSQHRPGTCSGHGGVATWLGLA
ncbi:MAG: DUF3761 domain-containing protein [bacterium]|nr:DUF3761 domain-containing protein [bacterium]